MNKEYFHNSATNTRYIRVSKSIAFKAYQDNQTILIAPVNANPHFWQGSLIHYVQYIPDDIPQDCKKQFEYVCNSIMYYNCNNELGNYLKYYLPQTIATKYGYKP